MIYDELVRLAALNPGRLAIVSGDTSCTFKDLVFSVDCCARNILEMTGTFRPRVAVISRDPVGYSVVGLAVAKIGGALIPVNPDLKAHQIEKILRSTLANLVVVDDEQQISLESVLISDLMRQNDSSIRAVEEWLSEPDYIITLSSGSTGEPKPIAISQRQKLVRAMQTIKHFDLTSKDVVLASSPFFHSLGQRLIFVGLLSGSTVVSLPRFSAESWCQAVSDFQVSFTISVPTQLYSVFDFIGDEYSVLSPLKNIVSSSAPIDPEFKDRVFRATGVRFSEIYGATEVAVVSLLEHDMVEKSGTVGSVCPGVHVKIMGDNGDEKNVGEIGEIWVKSEYSFSGYFSEKTGVLTPSEYFMTGDLGYLDEDKFLVFMGRSKDVIFCGGANVYPKDIEVVLMESDAVRDCAVFALPVDGYGEVVGAVCEVTANVDAVEVEMSLRGMCNRRLAPYQRPMRYHFTTDIPRTGVGKVDKIAIRREYAHTDLELGQLVKKLVN